MKVIKDNVLNEINIKNSRFICVLKYVENIDDINKAINDARNLYKDASHIVYAWKISNMQKYSDDGEPGGTAGAPVMEVLLKNDIINVLAIVVRYFGGIKLGAGGLIRAYSKSVREALLLTTLNDYVSYNYYELKTDYDNLKLLNILTNRLCIIEKLFENDITYKIKIDKTKDNIKEIFLNTKIKVKSLN